MTKLSTQRLCLSRETYCLFVQLLVPSAQPIPALTLGCRVPLCLYLRVSVDRRAVLTQPPALLGLVQGQLPPHWLPRRETSSGLQDQGRAEQQPEPAWWVSFQLGAHTALSKAWSGHLQLPSCWDSILPARRQMVSSHLQREAVS